MNKGTQSLQSGRLAMAISTLMSRIERNYKFYDF